MTALPYAAELDLALTAANEAGDLLLTHWRNRDGLVIEEKRAGDFMSNADMASETHLRQRLLGAFPDDAWMGEETGETGIGARRVWIVDPLDGTTNFLRGIPHFAVSIALMVDGEIVLGVIRDPARGETFSAVKGQGARLDGKAIAPAATASMSDALFGTGIPFGGMAHIDDHADDIARLMPHCAGVRRMGSAALDLAYVAAGRFDGFWERRLRLWDIAAGLVILREAGATVEAIAEDERPEDHGTVLTAAPHLFPRLAELIRSAGR